MGRLAAALSLVLILAGCGGGAQGSGSTPSTTSSITVAMGYFPDVQFAPFYVAIAKGYYRKAGLNVHFQYGIEPNLVRLAAQGKVDLVDAGGDEILAAGAQGLHVRYVMTQYARFPSAVFALKSSDISSPATLKGHTIGIPGKYGASYVGLLALLDRAGVPQSSVNIKSIGFTQIAAVSQHKVDSAVGFAMNEPVQLRASGTPVNEIDIYRYANLAGVGLAAGDTVLKQRPGVIRAFVHATLLGLRDTLGDPNYAFKVSKTQVSQIKAQPKLQRAVLQRCLAFWRAEPGHPLGWMNPAIWRLTARDLYRYKQIPRPVTASSFYTQRFVPGA